MQVRRLDIKEWTAPELMINMNIERRLKCLCVKENYESGGNLVLGTSYGEVIAISLGTTI